MLQAISLFTWIPLAGYILSLAVAKKRENIIASIAMITTCLQLIGAIGFSIFWLLQDASTLDYKLITLLTTPEFEFYIDFMFDMKSSVFLVVGSLIAFLVAIFSKFYIHREEGFKRYFNNLQLFFLGYSVVTVAGNFETFFLGWEMIGIASFLLISFYKNRYLPIKNAMKVVSIYRLGDIFLILAMWLMHHLWHNNIAFITLEKSAETLAHLQEHSTLGLAIGVAIFIGAAIKSAMFPFSSWVSRAMEGPSSSSAIFYGSLSIHLGVFLLLRTAPFWEHLIQIKILIIVFGVVTAWVCNKIASVQPTVKTQIAYASIAQIGLIFIEVGIGWHVFALVHFTMHAFLRTYQLLVSPSVLSYKVHQQMFESPVKSTVQTGKWKNTLYILSVKEFHMDSILYTYLWRPFKIIGTALHQLDHRLFYVVSILLLLAGIYLDVNTALVSPLLLDIIVYGFAVMALLCVLISFNERMSGSHAWRMVVLGHLFIMMSISLNSHIELRYLLLYLGSISFFGALGYIAIYKLHQATQAIHLQDFHGNASQHPRLSITFLIACVGLIGFPISPLYIGIDLLLTYIDKHQYIIMAFVALSLIFIEIALLRIYARLFCGLPLQSTEPVAFKYS